MAKTWAITGPAKTVLGNGTGEASFTITNQTAMAMRGLVRILPEGDAKPEMFKVVGESTLDWGVNETKQVVVQISAQGAAPGTYVYSCAVVSEGDPSELSDRISSSFEVAAAPEPKKFPVGILIAVIAGLLLIGGAAAAFFLLKGGGTVPDVTNMNIEEATQTLEDAGYLVASGEGEPSDSVDPGNVIRTDPAKDAELEEGETVTVILSRGSPIPDVAGQDQATAEGALTEAGFTLTVSTENSDTVASGLVIGTDPAAGQTVDPGQSVTLIVSAGPATPASVTVPDLIGLDFSQAESALTAAGLGLFSQCQVDIFGQGRVTLQIPGVGSQVPPGSDVSVLITQQNCFFIDFDDVIIFEPITDIGDIIGF